MRAPASIRPQDVRHKLRPLSRTSWNRHCAPTKSGRPAPGCATDGHAFASGMHGLRC